MVHRITLYKLNYMLHLVPNAEAAHCRAVQWTLSGEGKGGTGDHVSFIVYVLLIILLPLK